MIHDGVQFVSGYGLTIAIERGHLVINHGIAGERETLRFSRVDRDLKRLVVLGHSGTVTLDALRWLTDISAAFVHLDNDGTLVTVGVPGELNDIRVRRGQAYAAVNGVGLDVVRELLGEKISGQQRVGEQLGAAPDLMEWMDDARAALPAVDTIRDLRLVEARAAAAYWQAWEGIKVHFPRSEHARVPDHWRRYDSRHSVLSASPRKASNPVNALLNYLYAILEAEARIALRLVGADPGMGFLHLDNPRRESFALDLMEPARPDVDAYVLELLDNHTFSRSDFFETREGMCRLMPSIAKPMSATALRWAEAVAPFAERMAGRFAAASETVPTDALPVEARPLPKRFRTPLTQHNRRLAHGGRSAPVRRKVLKKVCRRCGTPLGNLERTYCMECREANLAERAAKGRAKLERLRAEGRDARSSKRAREKRRRANDGLNEEIAVWERENPGDYDPEVFRQEIAPQLAHLSGRELANATGLSLVYCNMIRRGRVPHPRHWAALRKLAEAAPVVEHTHPEYYKREILPKLADFTPQEIADATGLSVGHCKRIRRGTRMPGVRWWGALERLAQSGARRRSRETRP